MIPDDRKRSGLLISHSVRDNLLLSSHSSRSRLGIRNFSAEREVLERTVAALRIKVRKTSQPVQELSGGNQQKVLLARVLESGARIILMYDPTRGVDIDTKGEIYRLVRSLSDDGYSILIFSTDEQELVGLCHRALVMSRGRVVGELASDELSEDSIARLALGGR